MQAVIMFNIRLILSSHLQVGPCISPKCEVSFLQLSAYKAHLVLNLARKAIFSFSASLLQEENVPASLDLVQDKVG